MSIRSRKTKYQIPRIEIKVRDPSIFTDLALFFDREDALNDVAALRKSWIGKTLVPHKEVNNFLNKKRDLKEAKEFWYGHWPQIYRIAKKYGLRENFISPISSAVLSGIVVERDYIRVFQQDIRDNLPEEYRLSEKSVMLSNNVRAIDLRGLETKQDDKSITTIKRDREWYWLYQEMGYRKIAKRENQTLTSVISAINSYASKLRTYYSVTK